MLIILLIREREDKMLFKLLNEQAGIMDSDDIAIVKQFESKEVICPFRHLLTKIVRRL